MATQPPPQSLVSFTVTPRFDVFYALRALGERAERTSGWRHKTESLLPKGFLASVKRVAPRPMLWALLADVLRDAKPDPDFSEILQAIESLDDTEFQKAILGGVFRGSGTVAALVAGTMSLGDAVSSEGETGSALVALIGLHPFNRSGAVASAFNRILNEPGAYRAELARCLGLFWDSGFSDTWRHLEPRMSTIRDSMRSELGSSSLSSFAQTIKLPVAFDDTRQAVISLRGTTTFLYGAIREIHVIPSAFNDARIWGAYSNDHGSVRLYFPVFYPGLLAEEGEGLDPALGFRALGDTTRYAMAALLARAPRTSVELARAFGVSKATISHHVHLLRLAGLLRAKATDDGVVLTLDRGTLERISAAAAEEMFEGDKSPVIRRSRRQDKSGPLTAGTRIRSAAPKAEI